MGKKSRKNKKKIKKTNRNISKNNILNIEFKKFDIFIPIIFFASFINSWRAAKSQYYLLEYEDDISWVFWVSEHISSPLTLLSQGPGNGYRPVMNLLYATGYWLWGANEYYYFILNGLLFAGSMLFLYSLIKLLSDRISGIIAIFLYLFLDSTFILLWKINYIASLSVMFFISASLYFSIHFFEKTDKKSMVLAALFAILAFFSKESSISIIPSVNIMYLIIKWNDFKSKFRLTAIFINLVPIIIFLVYITFFPYQVAILKSGSLMEVANTRMIYYFEHELSGQLKNPYLFFLGCIGTFYFYPFKKERYGRISLHILKNVASIIIIFAVLISTQTGNFYSSAWAIFIVLLLALGLLFGNIGQRLGIIWFLTGFIPLLFVSLEPVQPTYLAEPNMGLVLFIGVTVSTFAKCILSQITIKNSMKNKKLEQDTVYQSLFVVNSIIVILILLIQLSVVPVQINNSNDFFKKLSDNEKSFKESVDYLRIYVPENGIVYYVSEDEYQKMGERQIDSVTFWKLLCLKGRCDIEIRKLSSLEINNETDHPGEFIALLGNLDLYIFSYNYNSLLREDLYISKKFIQNGERKALILELN